MRKQLNSLKVIPEENDERIQRLTKLTARLVAKMLDQKANLPLQPRREL